MPEAVTVLILRDPNGRAHATYASIDNPTVPHLLKEVFMTRGVNPDQIEVHDITLDDDISTIRQVAMDFASEGDRVKARILDELHTLRPDVDDILRACDKTPADVELAEDVLSRALGTLRLLKRMTVLAHEKDVTVPGLAEIKRRLEDALGVAPKEQPEPAWRTEDYLQAIDIAKVLIGDGSNAEYTRGAVELLADMFGVPGMFLADRMEQVAADLGLPPTAVS